MEESAKYLIHADVTASGVVEREDVVGAVYGQTEGLLGDELELRSLQEASKVGRIDVDVDSEGGRSFGELTIASSMDRVETAVLAASLETIGRVGPCRAEFRVTGIEDVRAAKRRAVVDRAKELLAASFDESAAASREILEDVRRAVRVEDATEYEGLPAGPNVADSDAIVVVEGRADVLTLLEYGIKNAVAVEGTNVPDEIATLTRDRTVTAFLDGDRGGDLIRKELAQVGDVDYVAQAPPDRSVEDLDSDAVMTALREKVPYEQFREGGVDDAAVPTDGGTVTGMPADGTATEAPADGTAPRPPSHDAVGRGGDAGDASADSGPATAGAIGGVDVERGENGTTDAGGGERRSPPDGSVADDSIAGESASRQSTPETVDEPTTDGPTTDESATGSAGEAADEGADRKPETLPGHVAAVVGEGSGVVRLLDDSFAVLAEAPADDAFETIEAAEAVPSAVVLDGTLTQRVLDVAAQRGVGQIVAGEIGDLVKQPVGVRIRTADEFR